MLADDPYTMLRIQEGKKRTKAVRSKRKNLRFPKRISRMD